MMRNRIIVLVVVLLTASFNLKAQNESKVIDKVVAVVGDNIILKSDLEAQIVSLRAQGVLVDENTRCELMEEMLFQKLLLHQAILDSVVVSEAEVEGELDRRMNYFIAQIGSEKNLEQYYKKSILEIKDELRGNIKDQMISQRMKGQISAGAAVTPKEVKMFFNSLHKDSVPTIESEVEYAQILFNAKESEQARQVAKDKINGFRERIVKGESFSTLAILYSEDPGSAKKGGELGFMGRAELVPEFSLVAFKLKNKAVSEVIETEFGFHIMQLIERRGQKVSVRHLLVKVAVDEFQIEIAKNLADSVFNLLQTDTLTFEELAAKYSDDEQTKKSRGLVVNPQTGTSIFQLDEVNPQIYYSIDKMEIGAFSKAVPAQSQDGKKGYRIIKLITKTAAHKASFEADYSKIQQVALADKQRNNTKDWIAGKVGNTYLKIDDEFKDCNFENNWIK
jgi:peptidyl-prolyl cis-trans isomerase SurA